MIKAEGQKIIRRQDYELLIIEAWGRDSIRVRATQNTEMSGAMGALIKQDDVNVHIEEKNGTYFLTNGKLKVCVTPSGAIKFEKTDTGETILREKGYIFEGPICGYPARYFRHTGGDTFFTRQEFEANPGERIYGMGQNANGFLNQKGTTIDLLQQNTQISIPFYLSSMKYGFLWNNPGIGKAELANNRTVWTAEQANELDYWVTAGDSYADILNNYSQVTGKPPKLPEWAAGFWQSKLRYATQDEVIKIATEYKKRGLPMDVIVIDFFHWPEMGDWKFDKRYWPDPEGMVKTLHEMGIRVMVSIWPTVSTRSENFSEMEREGYLVKNEMGIASLQKYMLTGFASEHLDGANKNPKNDRDYLAFYDSTNPEARQYMWDKVKENYYKYGIKLFWLDCNEPEMSHTQYERLRYHAGNGLAVASLYSNMQAKAFYDGLTAENETEVITLCRSGWAGIQRYGAILWSGDIMSTFDVLKRQVTAGLNVSLSGIPWWNTDIGGFFGGDRNSESFKELLIRWFQYGAFSPIFRLHGMRSPNEVWSYGEKAYEIMKKYMLIREKLKKYIIAHMDIAHLNGLPPMRPLFIDYEDDEECYLIGDQYLFGSDMIVAPITDEGAVKRRVYLPEGDWFNAWTGEKYNGKRYYTVDAPIDIIPVFVKTKELLDIFA